MGSIQIFDQLISQGIGGDTGGDLDLSGLVVICASAHGWCARVADSQPAEVLRQALIHDVYGANFVI